MLHNMLLDNKMEMSGGWSTDEVTPPIYADPNDSHPRTRWHRATDRTNWFELVDPVMQATAVVEEGYSKWRQRYVDHFYHKWSNESLKWPGPTEPNSSLRTPLPP